MPSLARIANVAENESDSVLLRVASGPVTANVASVPCLLANVFSFVLLTYRKAVLCHNASDWILYLRRYPRQQCVVSEGKLSVRILSVSDEIYRFEVMRQHGAGHRGWMFLGPAS